MTTLLIAALGFVVGAIMGCVALIALTAWATRDIEEIEREFLAPTAGLTRLSPKNQRALESLGVEVEEREARIWLNNQESRIARKQYTTQMIAATAAIVSAIAAVIAIVLCDT
jgi:hypothetical protein